MNSRVIAGASVMALALVASVSAWCVQEEPARRPVSVRDSIEMARFGAVLRDEARGSDAGGFSPDGRHYARLTHQAVFPAGKAVSKIWLFETQALKAAVEGAQPVPPLELASMAATANGAVVQGAGNVIVKLRWGNDGKSVLVLAFDDDENRHLFRVDVATGKVVPVSPTGQDVVDFETRGDVIVFYAKPQRSLSNTWMSVGDNIPDIQIGTGLPLVELLYPSWRASTARDVRAEVWKVEGNQARPLLDPATGMTLTFEPVSEALLPAISLSPDAKFAVVQARAAAVPKSWTAYEIGVQNVYNRVIPDDGAAKSGEIRNSRRPQQYLLVNLETGAIRPVLDAPAADPVLGYYGALRALWSVDGSRVALTNTFLPLEGTSGHRKAFKLVVLDVRRGSVETAIPMGPIERDGPWLEEAWTEPGGDQVAMQFARRSTGERTAASYEFKSGRWTAVEHSVQTPPASNVLDSIEIAIQETLDDPPVLAARNKHTGAHAVVFDPNPQLRSLDRGRAEIVEWRDRADRRVIGGLLLPPGFIQGKRYPLVISTHGLRPRQYLDTPNSSGGALRAMAARGIVVLQVQEHRDHVATPREATEDGEAVYLSAIDYLDKRGIIDPRHVGIIGHSRTGAHTWTTLFHAPDRFAAAAMTSAETVNVMTYLSVVDYANPLFLEAYEAFVGSKPFGEGAAQWVQNSPGFNMDRIHAPVLMGMWDPWQLIFGWGPYASLRALKKPVELLYIRSGNHPLMKPLHRLTAQEMYVDWFDFWLNAHEDVDPRKTEQYVRWRELRALHEADLRGWKG